MMGKGAIPGTDKALLCTLGPSSLNEATIRRLSEAGATLFRLNLSHTSLDELRPAIELIERSTCVPVCIDTEGAQIRTGWMAEGFIELGCDKVVRIVREPIQGDEARFNLYPHDTIDLLEVGDIVSIDFNSALVQVLEIDISGLLVRVLNGGRVGQNKAVSVQRDIFLPPLTAKDQAATAIAIEMNVNYHALSFANSAADVRELRHTTGEGCCIISKIESRRGLKNLDEIALASDALLIDRGDLSHEVMIEQIPRLQKAVIRRARRFGRPIYVATNLLESMVDRPSPTRAEVNDVYNTLSDGADGLVLAAETAIGAYPVRCAEMVVRMVREHQRAGDDEGLVLGSPHSLLAPPHGGRLVERVVAHEGELHGLIELEVSRSDLMDCEQLATGTFSPLCGFMDQETLSSVLEKDCLPDGTIWPMPILLQLPRGRAERLTAGERVGLASSDGTVHALIDVREIYRLDMEHVAQKWFGSSSRDHPGVRRFFAAGEVAIAGEVTLVRPVASLHKAFELSPRKSRYIFAHNGWSRVVGFHTRNVCHRAHEYLQISALRKSNADGIYISPVVGEKKSNDFLAGPILESYRILFESGQYEAEQRLLGSFSTYSRYAGPREALFTALCRKNMGCSHFILGRDHTGVGNFYPADANARYFEKVGDIGIEPLFFDAIGYNPLTRSYGPIGSNENVITLSGTQFRQTLLSGRRVPDWFVRDSIQDMLLEELSAGRQVFHG